MERELLGVYVSEHPLREAAGLLRSAVTCQAAELSERRDREEVTVGGIIGQVSQRMTRDGRAMANVVLEDMTGPINVVFFPRAYEAAREELAVDRIVLIKGRACVRERLGEDDESAPVVVELQGDSVTPVQTASSSGPMQSVHVRLQQARRQELLVLKQLFEANPGSARLMFHIGLAEEEERILSKLRVEVNQQLIREASAVAGRVGGVVWVD
jgi:DNA polymerase-3 subunit alpha